MNDDARDEGAPGDQTTANEPEPDSRAQYLRDVTDPARWRDKAEDLLATAEYVKVRVEESWQAIRERRDPPGKRFDDVHGPYFMLVAFALENLCKAILVNRRRHELPVDGIDELPRFLNTHDLPGLLQSVGITVDTWFLGVLERLRRASVWAGRYPVPASLRELERPSRGLHHYSPDDFDDLRQLIAAVEKVATREFGSG